MTANIPFTSGNGPRAKDHYFTVEVDVLDLYRDRTDADARFIRYLMWELSNWRVRAQNLDLKMERFRGALAERGEAFIDISEEGDARIATTEGGPDA